VRPAALGRRFWVAPQLHRSASGLSARRKFMPPHATATTAVNGGATGGIVNIVRYVLAISLLLLAIAVVVTNWACVIVDIRNRRRGIHQHYSTTPFFFSVVCTFLAYQVYPRADKLWMLSIPLLDIAKWGLLALPTVWFRAGRADDTAESKRVRGPDA